MGTSGGEGRDKLQSDIDGKGEELEGDFLAIVAGRSGSMKSGDLTWCDVLV